MEREGGGGGWAGGGGFGGPGFGFAGAGPFGAAGGGRGGASFTTQDIFENFFRSDASGFGQFFGNMILESTIRLTFMVRHCCVVRQQQQQQGW